MEGLAVQARNYALQLLDTFPALKPDIALPTVVHTWHTSGLADVSTCESDNGLSLAADASLLAFQSLATNPIPIAYGSALLTERARLDQLTSNNSPKDPSSMRLLATQGGMIILNLPRPSDWELLPALFEHETQYDWPLINHHCRRHKTEHLVERGRLLGLAIADAISAPNKESWITRHNIGKSMHKTRAHRVIDLSSLWAGPLCGRLLQLAGCDVIKIESTQRPDGARQGNPEFYQRLNDNKQSVVLDFSNSDDITTLIELVRKADIVIEASRPRALAHLGIHAEQLCAETPGLTWLSLTAYGRSSPYGDWIGFGDDVAVSAGLSYYHFARSGEWRILGDALADPLTGLHAAVAALASQASGGGELIEIAMHKVVSFALQQTSPLAS